MTSINRHSPTKKPTTQATEQTKGHSSGDATTAGTGDAAATSQASRAAQFPSVGDTTYEVSDPRQRLSIDRAQATVPAADAGLANELSALRATGGATGRHVIGDGSEGIVGMGRNNGANSLRSSRGRIAAEDWDQPERIVGHLTQTPGSGRRGNSRYRCAPSNLFAAAMMNSPNHAARMLENTANGARSGQLPQADKTELNDIAGRIRDRSATYEDLSRAQGLLYNAGNTETNAYVAADQTLNSPRISRADKRRLDALLTKMERPGTTLNATDRSDLERILTTDRGSPVSLSLITDPHNPNQTMWGVNLQGAQAATDRSGFNDAEVSALAQTGGAATSSRAQIDISTERPMANLVDQLQPGQSATVRVHHTDIGANDLAAPDHFITVGKRGDGTPYVYNSDPSRRDHTLFVGAPGGGASPGFEAELDRYDNRIAFEDDGDVPQAVTTTFSDDAPAP